MSHPQFATRLASYVLAVAALAVPGLGAAQVSLITLGTPHTQNFDTLPATGTIVWANDSTIPGWFHARTGTGTNLVANNGSNNAGNLYNYGTTSATDRALGSVGSTNAAVGNMFWGVRLQNNTGATITSLDVSYVGEQWRIGGTAVLPQTVAFSYLVGSPAVTGTLAEFQAAGVAVTALDFTSPTFSSATGAALDGNLAANRVLITSTITGLSIPAGTEVMLRWSDPEHPSSDHGMSIDEFSVTPQGAPPAGADLVLTNSDSPDPVDAGTDLTYTITVANNGPAAAADTEWSQPLPAGTTFVSLPAVAGWSCTTPAIGATGTVSCTNPSVGTPSNDVFTLTVNVDAATPAGTVLAATATVSSTTTDPVPGNESATATTTVSASADLSVTKTDSADPVFAGGLLSYTITVDNAGPSNSATVGLLDSLPAATTFAALSSPAGWSCTTPAVGANGAVNCVNTSMAVGSAVFTLDVTVGASTPGGTVISNSAILGSATFDPNGANNGDSEDTTVGNSADVSLTKTDSPDPVTAGGSLTYTLTVTNAGPDEAQSLSLSDELPGFVTFASIIEPAGWSCTTPAVGSGGVVGCSAATMPVGTAVITLVVTVNPGTAAGTEITNNAFASTLTNDPVFVNGFASATTTVGSASADLSITKTDSPDPVTAGDNLTYTITATNNGPNDSTTVSVTDTLPAGTTFVSLAAPAGWSCTTPAVGGTGAVTCDNATLANGASGVFTLVVAVDAGTAGGTVISNTATITGAVADPNGGNDSATATTTVAALDADLSVTKTGLPANVAPGANLTYTVNVANAGPSAATAVVLTDVVPANTTFVSATAPAGWSLTTPAVGGTGTITATNASLASGASGAFTFVVQVGAATPDATVITNTASIASATPDSDAGDNSSTTTSTVQVATTDVSVAKTDTPDPVTAGGNITYAIVVANSGPSAAANVSLTDTLPANTTFVSATAPAGWTLTTPAVGGTGTITATNPSLASAGVANFTVVVQVAAATANGTVISNTANVSTTTADSNAANDTSTATTTVTGLSADLSVTKTDAPDPVVAGSNLTYTIVAANAGPNDATAVTLTDVLPANTTFVSLTGAGGWTITTPAVGATGTVTLTNPTLAATAAHTFTLVVQVNAGVAAGTVISNTATIASTTADPSPANNTATTTSTTSAAPAANVNGTKTAAGSFQPGSTVTYTIVLTNSGSGAQGDNAGNEFTDVLPASLQLVSATATSGTAVATIGTNTVTWNGAIPAAGTVTITITATIPAATVPGTTITNQGTISTDLDNNATNETTRTTDDPSTGGADATGFVVQGSGSPFAEPITIPAFGDNGRMLLMLLLAVFAVGALGRMRK